MHRALKHIERPPKDFYSHLEAARTLDSKRNEERKFDFEGTQQRSSKIANKLEGFIMSDDITSKNAGAALRLGNHSLINFDIVNNNHNFYTPRAVSLPSSVCFTFKSNKGCFCPMHITHHP